MESHWQTRADRVSCSWSEAADLTTYVPPWADAPVEFNVRSHPGSGVLLDLSRLSRFGGTQWYGLRPALTDSLRGAL